jgi:hypothetical protein
MSSSNSSSGSSTGVVVTIILIAAAAALVVYTRSEHGRPVAEKVYSKVKDAFSEAKVRIKGGFNAIKSASWQRGASGGGDVRSGDAEAGRNSTFDASHQAEKIKGRIDEGVKAAKAYMTSLQKGGAGSGDAAVDGGRNSASVGFNVGDQAEKVKGRIEEGVQVAKSYISSLTGLQKGAGGDSRVDNEQEKQSGFVVLKTVHSSNYSQPAGVVTPLNKVVSCFNNHSVFRNSLLTLTKLALITFHGRIARTLQTKILKPYP